MPNTYFTSDSHYGHLNIIEKFSTWTDKSGCRKFDSMDEMKDALVNGINKVVQPDDVLYHLGDFNFGGMKNQHEFRRRIKCETIHLVMGNHDFNHRSLIEQERNNGNFASVQDYKEIVVNGQEIILSHYAHRVWNRQSKGSWHLYGHSHGQLPSLCNFSMDVGVDAKNSNYHIENLYGAFNPTPWSFTEINEFFHMFRLDKIICEDAHDREEASKPIGAN